MEDILSAHPYVNVLLAENDAMALGAIKIISQMGKREQIKVLGFDGQKEAIVCLKVANFTLPLQ